MSDQDPEAEDREWEKLNAEVLHWDPEDLTEYREQLDEEDWENDEDDKPKECIGPQLEGYECEGHLALKGRPTITEGYVMDSNDIPHPRYVNYKCDKCGGEWTLDISRNNWS